MLKRSRPLRRQILFVLPLRRSRDLWPAECRASPNFWQFLFMQSLVDIFHSLSQSVTEIAKVHHFSTFNIADNQIPMLGAFNWTDVQTWRLRTYCRKRHKEKQLLPEAKESCSYIRHKTSVFLRIWSRKFRSLIAGFHRLPMCEARRTEAVFTSRRE